MTVRELLSRVSASEIAEWMAYDSLDPIGRERGDLQAGVIASTIANTMGGGRKDGQPHKPVDFMPYVDRPKPEIVKKFRASMVHLVEKAE